MTETPASDVHGIFTSLVVQGFRLRVDWLWRRPLPKVLDAAAEFGLLDR